MESLFFFVIFEKEKGFLEKDERKLVEASEEGMMWFDEVFE